MRLLLVYPSTNSIGLSQRVALVEPLPLEYLAAAVPQEHEVGILDLRVSKESLHYLLSTWEPDMVGITGLTMDVPEMISLSQQVKAISRDIKVAVGGHHATFMPSSFMLPSVDIIARGQCESVIGMILNSELSRVPGLIYRSGGEWVENAGRPLSIFPKLVPAHQLVREHAHRYHMLNINCSAMQMNRGCPYSCSFCDAHKFFDGHYEHRQVESAVEEVASLPAKFVFLADDNIGLNPSFMSHLVSRLAQRDVNKRYWITIGAKEVLRNRKWLDNWFDIGLRVLFVGMERVDDEGIARLGKRTTVRENDRVIEYIHSRHGIVVASFIILPTDTKEYFQRLEEYILSRQIDMPFLCILTPFPGTEIWAEHRHKIHHDFSKYDFMHAIIPTSLDVGEFYSQFYHLYTTVNLPRLLLAMVKTVGLGSWLFKLPRINWELKRLCHSGQKLSA